MPAGFLNPEAKIFKSEPSIFISRILARNNSLAIPFSATLLPEPNAI